MKYWFWLYSSTYKKEEDDDLALTSLPRKVIWFDRSHVLASIRFAPQMSCVFPPFKRVQRSMSPKKKLELSIYGCRGSSRRLFLSPWLLLHVRSMLQVNTLTLSRALQLHIWFSMNVIFLFFFFVLFLLCFPVFLESVGGKLACDLSDLCVALIKREVQ